MGADTPAGLPARSPRTLLRPRPYVYKNGDGPIAPPYLCAVKDLVPYEISVTCAGCGANTYPDVPSLLAKRAQSSFSHLVTQLTCQRCGSQAESIEICRKVDIPIANHPAIIYENPMCRRFTMTATVAEARNLFNFRNTPNLQPRYNIGTNQTVSTVIAIEGERELVPMRWGLIPSWAKDEKIGAGMVNAREETVAEKPAFRSAFKSRHCLVLADGFYEWQHDGKEKLPWRFTLPDGGLFSFAGLHETWTSPAGETIRTCTIITQQPFNEVAPYHDRSPVILAPEAHDDWLHCRKTDTSFLGVKRYSGPLKAYRVGREVGNAKDNDHPGLIEPLQPAVSSLV